MSAIASGAVVAFDVAGHPERDMRIDAVIAAHVWGGEGRLTMGRLSRAAKRPRFEAPPSVGVPRVVPVGEVKGMDVGAQRDSSRRSEDQFTNRLGDVHHVEEQEADYGR